jgi:hypothetical protein
VLSWSRFSASEVRDFEVEECDVVSAVNDCVKRSTEEFKVGKVVDGGTRRFQFTKLYVYMNEDPLGAALYTCLVGFADASV